MGRTGPPPTATVERPPGAYVAQVRRGGRFEELGPAAAGGAHGVAGRQASRWVAVMIAYTRGAIVAVLVFAGALGVVPGEAAVSEFVLAGSIALITGALAAARALQKGPGEGSQTLR